MTRPRGIGDMRIENFDRNADLLVGLMQFFSLRTDRTLKSTSLVAYSVHAIVLYFYVRRKQWLIDNGYTLLGFLLVFYTLKELEEEEAVRRRSVNVRISVIDDSAVGEWCTGHWKFREEKTGDECISASNGSSGAFAEI